MRQHKLLWASSYDRGILYLLKMWPSILEKAPDATLDICYGWDLFDKAYQNNPERMNWKDKVNKLMEQKGITHHGRVGKDELNKITSECGIWAYTTDFDEINCITALNCQRYGTVPCVINRAALKETVGSGVKVDGEIWDPEVKAKYLQELLDLMTDKKKWEVESKKAIEFSKGYEWGKIADSWLKEFEISPEDKVIGLIKEDKPLDALELAKELKLNDMVWKLQKKLSHILNWNEYLAKYQDNAVQGFRTDDENMVNADKIYPRYHWITDEIKKNNFKSIIDCGCYDGLLVSTCNKLGLEATGVEMGKDHVAKNIEANKRLGLSVNYFQGDILDFKGKADIVTCLEVIEHVPDPKKLIDHLATLGGWVYMSTPLGAYDPIDTIRIWNEETAQFDHVRSFQVDDVEKLLEGYKFDIFTSSKYIYFRYHK